MISTGGTGITGRDVTNPEAFAQVWDKEIVGFGELFRALSFKTIGTSTIQSRACAGVARGTYLFAAAGIESARSGTAGTGSWKPTRQPPTCPATSSSLMAAADGALT